MSLIGDIESSRGAPKPLSIDMESVRGELEILQWWVRVPEPLRSDKRKPRKRYEDPFAPESLIIVVRCLGGDLESFKGFPEFIRSDG